MSCGGDPTTRADWTPNRWKSLQGASKLVTSSQKHSEQPALPPHRETQSPPRKGEIGGRQASGGTRGDEQHGPRPSWKVDKRTERRSLCVSWEKRQNQRRLELLACRAEFVCQPSNSLFQILSTLFSATVHISPHQTTFNRGQRTCTLSKTERQISELTVMLQNER